MNSELKEKKPTRCWIYLLPQKQVAVYVDGYLFCLVPNSREEAKKCQQKLYLLGITEENVGERVISERVYEYVLEQGGIPHERKTLAVWTECGQGLSAEDFRNAGVPICRHWDTRRKTKAST